MSEHDALIDRIAGARRHRAAATAMPSDAASRPRSRRGARSCRASAFTVGDRSARHATASTRVERLRRGPGAGAGPGRGRPAGPHSGAPSEGEVAAWRGASPTRAARARRPRSAVAGGRRTGARRCRALAPAITGLLVEAGRRERRGDRDRRAAPTAGSRGRCAGGARRWGLDGPALRLRSAAQPRHRRLCGCRAGGRADAGALGASFLGLSPVHALFERRPHQDLALFAVLAPVPRVAASSTRPRSRASGGEAAAVQAPRLDEKRPRSPRCARLRSSTTPASGRLAARSSTRCGRRSRPRGDPAFDAFRREPAARRSRPTPPSRRCRSISAREGRWPGSATGRKPFRAAALAGGAGASRAEHGERVAFHAWLQWLADSQLAAACRRARARRA